MLTTMKHSIRRLSHVPAVLVMAFSLFVLSLFGYTDAKSRDLTQASQEKNTDGKTDNPLAGTQWRLVEFQSMDDAQGVQRPRDASRYTMQLNADGTVHMRLDCNNANGTWKLKASVDRSNGSFEFGSLATTRAFCPPPSMGQLVASQSKWVRGYLFKDGKLYLSLMADGGIFVWELQREAPFLNKPDAAIEQAILAASPDYRKSVVLDQKATYVYSFVDLDGDGKDEAIVYLMGSFFCGTGGCNMLVLTRKADGYHLVQDFPITRTPVIISPDTHNGWHDIWRTESGGGAKACYVRHMFNGKRYVEKGRKPTGTLPAGISCLAGDLNYASGVPLEPHD